MATSAEIPGETRNKGPTARGTRKVPLGPSTIARDGGSCRRSREWRSLRSRRADLVGTRPVSASDVGFAEGSGVQLALPSTVTIGL
jgi:hypothetical protein